MFISTHDITNLFADQPVLLYGPPCAKLHVENRVAAASKVLLSRKRALQSVRARRTSYARHSRVILTRGFPCRRRRPRTARVRPARSSQEVPARCNDALVGGVNNVCSAASSFRSRFTSRVVFAERGSSSGRESLWPSGFPKSRWRPAVRRAQPIATDNRLFSTVRVHIAEHETWRKCWNCRRRSSRAG